MTVLKGGMPAILQVTGKVREPQLLTAGRMAKAVRGQVRDVSQLDASRRGIALELEALIEMAQPLGEASELMIRSSDGFSAKVSLALVIDKAVVIYGFEGRSLPDAMGGPFRFLIPNAAACGTEALDTCANVKQVMTLELLM